MAGGIDWFRWHHGSVTDPKFQLVARKAGASLPEVLAVWAFLLEKASAADFRGCFGEVDAEAVDCLFALAEGTTDAIMAAMVERKLLADQYIVAWEKRQPKREDDTAAERKRRQREREHELKVQSRVTERDDTACHAESRSVTHGHDRGEERREEIQPPRTTHNAGGGAREPGEVDASAIVGDAKPTAAGAICRALRQAGIADVNPGHPRLLALIAAGATEIEFVGFAAGAVAKSAGFAWVLAAVENERKRAAIASTQVAQGVMPTSLPKSPTAPSNAAAETAAMLAAQAARGHVPPPPHLRRIARQPQDEPKEQAA